MESECGDGRFSESGISSMLEKEEEDMGVGVILEDGDEEMLVQVGYELVEG